MFSFCVKNMLTAIRITFHYTINCARCKNNVKYLKNNKKPNKFIRFHLSV